MKFLMLLLLFISVLTSCNRLKKLERFEGLLIYETDDSMLNQVPVDSGKYIKYFVKGDSVRVESYTPMGKQIHIRNHKSKTGVLIFVYAGKKIALLQDFKKDTIQRNFQLKRTEESAEIAELYSEKASVNGEHLKEAVDVYFAPNYPDHILDIYEGIIPGLPTKYQLIVQQLPVNYWLVKSVEQVIDNDKFSIPDDCTVLTMEEFLSLISKVELAK
jgi:hypothetical protein